MTFLVHIGLPKTATTTLQECLFDKHSGLISVGRPYPSEDARQAVFNLLPSQVPNLDIERSREQLETWCGPAYDAKGPVILSDEEISAEGPGGMPATVARFQQLLPPFEVLLTVREPVDHMESMYLQDMRGAPDRWPYRPFEDWLEVQWERLTTGKPSRIERLLLRDLLTPFEEAYGTEAIHVAVFEQLKADERAFVDGLCQLLGIETEEALDHLHGKRKKQRIRRSDLRLKRIGNVLPVGRLVPFLPAPVRRLGRRVLGGQDRADEAMDPGWQERIRETTRPHYQHLVDIYDVPLHEFGYPVDL